MSNEVSMGLIFLFFLSFFLFAPTHSGPPASPIYFLPFLPHNSIRSMITLQDIHFSLYHQTNQTTTPCSPPGPSFRNHSRPSQFANTHAESIKSTYVSTSFFFAGKTYTTTPTLVTKRKKRRWTFFFTPAHPEPPHQKNYENSIFFFVLFGQNFFFLFACIFVSRVTCTCTNPMFFVFVFAVLLTNC